MITISSSVRTFFPRSFPSSSNHLVLQTAVKFTFTLRRRRPLSTACSVSAANRKKKEKVIVISGPTGAGKSRLALELAKKLNGEIISADSVQVYRGLDIGSAKPPPSDRKEVPHHLIDILDPSEDYSVGQFFDEARLATRSILDSGRVPIVTGGTGLYLRWLVYGKPDVPKASQEIASEVYTELGLLQRNEQWDEAVQLVVKAGDPKAEELPANDWYRLRRKLEIIKSSGSPPSAFKVPYDSFRKQHDSGVVDTHEVSSSTDVIEEVKSKELDYDFICFFLSSKRVDLYRAIDWRCEEMVSGSDGILSEASWLLDAGLLPKLYSATKAIGYRQAMEYLLMCREQGGHSSLKEFQNFLTEFQKASRNFAKRQLTWFRNESIYHWLDASRPLETVLNFICDAYHDTSGHLVVPDSLRIKKELSSHQEASELKGYRPRNRLFIRREDCTDILEWIQRTQGGKMPQ